MSDEQVLKPWTIQLSNGSTATLTEEGGVRTDGTIVVVRSVTDDGAGNLAGGLGSVNYVGKSASLKAISRDRKVGHYRTDYDNAAAFESALEGTGSGAGARAGGTWGKMDVGEEMIAASSVVATYRVGAAAPRHSVQTFTPPVVAIDLTPYTSDPPLPGSIMFKWMGQTYSDFEGVIYRDRTDTNAGIASGKIVYETGIALMTDYVVGGTGPTDFQLLSLWTRKGQWSAACVFFNTESAPIRPGAGGFVLSVVDLAGDTLTANVDANGNVTGQHMHGRVEFSRGGVELQFGDFVLDASLTPAQKAEWWYNAADVGAVQPGKIWRPWPVDPTTLRYSSVTYIYLPVDVSLMGLDPAALPGDGLVPFVRPGETAVIGLTHYSAEFTPAVGMVHNVGAQRLSFAQVLAPDGSEIRTGYTEDLDAGTVTFTDLTGYPPKVRTVGRNEVYRQIAEARIDGRVKLTQPIGFGFPAGAVFSTALRQGDRFARVRRVYDQASWNGTTWYDGVDPSKGEATGTYNATGFPIEVANKGAITERWALRLRADGITFDLIGQHLGQIASGTINADFSPLNAAAGAPYMTVRAGGWGTGWLPGNVLFVDTIGAEFPIATVRCTQPSSPAGIADSTWIVQRGDVDRPPSA